MRFRISKDLFVEDERDFQEAFDLLFLFPYFAVPSVCMKQIRLNSAAIE